MGDENWGKSIEKKQETEQLTVKNDELMKELAQLSDGMEHLKVERKKDIWD